MNIEFAPEIRADFLRHLEPSSLNIQAVTSCMDRCERRPMNKQFVSVLESSAIKPPGLETYPSSSITRSSIGSTR